MNIKLIKIFSFFIGLFITLAILSYYNVNEKFTVEPEIEKDEKKENFEPLIIENQAIIPLHGYKFMCINTYDNKISLNEGKWYDSDSEKKNYNYNVNNYFKFNKAIDLIDNNLNNNGAKLANINGIQLNGPSCFNFANNSETFELTECSIFLVCKIDNFTTNNNILFELTGNTNTDINAKPSYSPSVVHVNFIIRENLNYDIHICIGNQIYSGLINDINKDVIHTPYYLILGLSYTSEKVSFFINKKVYEYVNINNTNKVYLGSTPLIINKYGSINMKLFNFVYYKSLYHIDYFDYFIRYNNYYISGLYFETLNKKCITKNIHILNVDDNLIDETPVNLNELENINKIGDEKDKSEKDNDKLRLLPRFKYDLMLSDAPSILHRIFNF